MRKMGIHKPTLLELIPTNNGKPCWLVLKVESIIQAKLGMIYTAFSNISFVFITNANVVSQGLLCLGRRIDKKSIFLIHFGIIKGTVKLRVPKKVVRT
jgi:hypothetical protein